MTQKDCRRQGEPAPFKRRQEYARQNDAFDGGRGLSFLVETDRSEFPVRLEWQNFQEGHYAFGIEPATNHVIGKADAAERGKLT